MKKILITGVNSYIGTSVEKWLDSYTNMYRIDTLDLRCGTWKNHDFSKYDAIFHVAGIAHDTGNKHDADLYYKVNRDLALETASKAKAEGVKQFIFMSSILVYNGCKDRIITKDTKPKVKGAYGDSKLQADLKLQEMNDMNFQVAIIRPPMIFGPNCKGNFPRLAGLAKKLSFFPNIQNQRSMLYIDNFCEFVRLLIDSGKCGVFFPQNEEYFSTTEIVKGLNDKEGKKIKFTKLGNWLVYLLRPFSNQINKLFGNLVYDKELSKCFNKNYIVVDNKTSISLYDKEKNKKLNEDKVFNF